MLGAIATMRQGAEAAAEMLALARLACDVPDEIDDAPVFAAIRSLLDAYEEFAVAEPDNRRRLTFLILAATVARTPEVPVPESVTLESRFRSQISRSPVSVSRSSTSSIVSRTNGTSAPASPPVAITRGRGAELGSQPPHDPLDLTGEPVDDPAADRVDGRLADQRARLGELDLRAAWRRGRTGRRSRSRRPG